MMESNDFGNYDRTQDLKKFGHKRYTFFATRYDYLRLAKAMLDDWQNDTCVGKYLKNIFENRIVKSVKKKKHIARVRMVMEENMLVNFTQVFLE